MVRPRGELDPMTYRRLGDDLVKFAMEQPRAVIVVVDELRVRSDPLLTVFATAWMRVGEWPGVPIVVVAEDDDLRRRLAHTAIDRFVAVHASVGEALDGVDEPAPRWRARLPLVLSGDCAQRARRVVEEVCLRWGVPEVCADAQLVVTELVENALAHTADREIQLRLELRHNLLTVAVADEDPREAMLRESVGAAAWLHGLHVVARIARSWGCAPQWPIGKVVWAALQTDGRVQ
ncbi:ATP-binding protein [Nocardia transvalensis]|uniref:ATP-binding protein n=1 Tax=Nocardia transvalensis TaxID=37333 RepID=UPI0018963349|nr:ATP-binding protein [Nocardia transvalensis]MBF6327366.1 ATP-binding protein [Nocardia transvalensis]